MGVKIYETDRDYPGLFEEWEELGINTCFVSVDLARDSLFRDLAKENDIKLFVILPVFFNPEALESNPEWYAITDRGIKAKEEWVEFISPSQTEYVKARIVFIRDVVKEVKPDGISLDFIRYFAFWEKIYANRTLETIPNSSFDPESLSDFQDQTGIRIPPEMESVSDKAGWIINHYEPRFTEWKCRRIEQVAREIAMEVKKAIPDLIINIHLVPWRQSDFDGAVRKIVGQDVTFLSPLVDYISPMCYAHMLKREAQWVHDVVQDIYISTDSADVLPSIQVKEAYLETPLTASEFEANLRAALRHPSKGVVLWSWDHLELDPEKKVVLRRVF